MWTKLTLEVVGVWENYRSHVVGGTGLHGSPLGDQHLAVGDVVLLRPGAWHSLEECVALEVFNCCFAPEMLRRELAWTREDPMLSYLLFEGPYTPGHRGTRARRACAWTSGQPIYSAS